MQSIGNTASYIQHANAGRRGKRERGHSVLEASLMAPWIFLLFMFIFDFGYWAFAAISTANAARVAALYTASDSSVIVDQAGACAMAKRELKYVPNSASFASDCSSGVLQVTTASTNGPDGQPASQVTVAYQTAPLFRLPGFAGQWTITRIAEMSLTN
ncbi:MAG TPA: TadE family protein [Terriglobales bacterium]|nr:TadE family protein [Terriglobales bacterium]